MNDSTSHETLQRQSQETLQRISQNDHTLTRLHYRYSNSSTGIFNSSSTNDFSRLGKAIATNQHLKTLLLHADNMPALISSNTEFYNGLRQNSSIHDLHVWGGSFIVGPLPELLKVYQDNSCLTNIMVVNARNIQDGGVNIIATTLQCCTNVKHINLGGCNIADSSCSRSSRQ